MEKMQKPRGTRVSVHKQVKSATRYSITYSCSRPTWIPYYVLYATKKTKKGSPWVKGVLYLKKRIDGCNYKWVHGILNVLTGRQLTLYNL
jgi:hypothetical protein